MVDHQSKIGVAAIADGLDARALALTAGDSAEQAALFEEYEPAASSLPFAGSKVTRTGPGRPKGAINKRTADFRDYILRRYGDPLTGLADVAFTPIPDLAKELQCETLEAARFWLACRAEILPYVMSKLPTEVAVKDDRIPALIIGEINAGSGTVGIEAGPEGVRIMSIGESK